MNRLEWDSKITEVFIRGIPIDSPLSIGQIKKELAVILQEFGELSKIDLIPPRPGHRSRCAIVKFTWSDNAIKCIKYLHEKDVASNFGLSTRTILSAQTRQRKERSYGNSAQEKRLLLDLVNEQIKKEVNSVPDIAKVLGKSDEISGESTIYTLHELVKDIDVEDINERNFEAAMEDFEKMEAEPEVKLQFCNKRQHFHKLPDYQKRIVAEIMNDVKRNSNNVRQPDKDSFHSNELEDRTNIAFGFSGKTKVFKPRDIQSSKPI